MRSLKLSMGSLFTPEKLHQTTDSITTQIYKGHNLPFHLSAPVHFQFVYWRYSGSSTHTEVPDANLSSQAAWGQDVIGWWVEGYAPGSARMSLKYMVALASLQVCHADTVVTMGWGHLGAAKNINKLCEAQEAK